MAQNIFNPPDYPKEQFTFIKSVSNKEWILNGWRKEDPSLILSVFNAIALFVRDGNYLELGCGSGILCKFLFLFSGKRMIPFGIDVGLEAIRLAQKNNPQFADNFQNEDYFDFLESPNLNLAEFSLVATFVNLGSNNWNKLKCVLIPLIKSYPKINFLICDYDDDFIPISIVQITEFISAIQKISKISIVCHSMLVIGNDENLHKIARKFKKSISMHLNEDQNGVLNKKIITGFVAERNQSSFSLTKTDVPQCQLVKQIFFLSPKCRITKINYLYATKTMSTKVIDWTQIQKGDKVRIMFGKNKQTNIVIGIDKLD